MFVFNSLLERLTALDIKDNDIIHVKDIKKELKKIFGKEITIDTDETNTLDRYQFLEYILRKI